MDQWTARGFFSYARLNDKADGGYLTRLRERLSDEVSVLLGQPFPIFQDRDDIATGDRWRDSIFDAIDESTIFIPVVTPNYLRSEMCRNEFERFLLREAALGRHDLITPIYYIACPELQPGADDVPNEMATVVREVAARNYDDWRQLRGKALRASAVQVRVRHLAQDIAARLRAVAPEPSRAPSDGGARTQLLEFTDTSRRDEVNAGLLFAPPYDLARLPSLDLFVGRTEEVDWLSGQLSSDDPIAIVVGMAGIGKSTLVAQAVAAVGAAETYPDGIAVVQAHGISDDTELLRATLSRFDANHRLSSETGIVELADVARNLLAGRRTLVVLDDIPPHVAVHDVVKILRGAGTAVLVTARHTPSGFPANAHRLLGGLAADDGVTLLREMSGGTTVGSSAWREGECAAAARIVDSVASHPLALRVVGAYIGDLQRDVQAVADELRNPARVLDLSSGEDAVLPPVRSALVRSYEALPARAQRAFAALAVFSTGEFGRAAALAVVRAAPSVGAAKSEMSDASAEQAINILIRRAFLTSAVNVRMPKGAERERVRLHPLLTALASEQFASWTEKSQQEAYIALARHYVTYLTSLFGEPGALSVSGTLREGEREAGDETLAVDVGNITRVLEWVVGARDPSILDPDERDRLIVRLCGGLQLYWRTSEVTSDALCFIPEALAALGRLETTSPASRDLCLQRAHFHFTQGRALRGSGHPAEAEQEVRACLDLRRKCDDSLGTAAALNLLGQVEEVRGAIDDAAGYFRESLQLCARLEVPWAEAAVALNLGRIESNRYCQDEAEPHLARAEELARAGDFAGLIEQTLYHRGRLALQLRDLERAERAFEELSERARQRHSRWGEFTALHELGQISRLRGELDKCGEYLRAALASAVEGRYKRQQGIAHNALGNYLITVGMRARSRGDKETARRQFEQARSQFRETLAIARELGDIRMEGTQLTLLGWVGWLLGDGVRAEPLLKQGLDLARKAQNPDDIGVALRVLGEIAQSRGLRGQAIHYFQESLAPLRRARREEDVRYVQDLLRQLHRR